MFTMESPPRSRRRCEVLEVDRFRWLDLDVARSMMILFVEGGATSVI
jgi:predicted NUDIX family NTP pyrophosphohydrolase